MLLVTVLVHEIILALPFDSLISQEYVGRVSFPGKSQVYTWGVQRTTPWVLVFFSGSFVSVWNLRQLRAWAGQNWWQVQVYGKITWVLHQNYGTTKSQSLTNEWQLQYLEIKFTNLGQPILSDRIGLRWSKLMAGPRIFTPCCWTPWGVAKLPLWPQRGQFNSLQMANL